MIKHGKYTIYTKYIENQHVQKRIKNFNDKILEHNEIPNISVKENITRYLKKLTNSENTTRNKTFSFLYIHNCVLYCYKYHMHCINT